jgi:superfamily I DNA/RNA helicase
VLVDEYQDTNGLQAAILLGLKPDGFGLTVVGDDAQAIYGFRAANVRNILDFPGQFVPPATDGCIPSEKSAGNADEIEEERRLLYVAMTRAKDELSLIVPHRFYPHGQSHSDNHLYALRSRFIPESIVGAFDERTCVPLARSGHSVRRSGGVAVDLSARMRGKWRDIGS